MADKDISPGDRAAWNWGGSSITVTVSFARTLWLLEYWAGDDGCLGQPTICCCAQVTKEYTEHAEIESKGKTITRNATEDNPAYKVERPGKNPVLKKVGVPAYMHPPWIP